ncbi:Uma2 family endonuclease [Streptodolium elevatio]|uniref:Uma2 family endonuclease n=1 Tax=Streptodolium elevatio TaxID=3157996 RepID=A0ABV3DKT3_9ACTN
MVATIVQCGIPELLDRVDAPEGFRVEYVEGMIVITPPPDDQHETIAESVLYAFIRSGLNFVRPAARGYCLMRGCTDMRKGNHVIPDLTVASRAFTDAERAAAEQHRNWMPAEALDLVVEVTGSNITADTKGKYAAYARLNIPIYLLVNRDQRTATVFTDPSGDVQTPGYAVNRVFKFGQPLVLPEPYPELDTASW